MLVRRECGEYPKREEVHGVLRVAQRKLCSVGRVMVGKTVLVIAFRPFLMIILAFGKHLNR